MKHDIIVLGAGPGGYVAAVRAAQLGFSTAVVEREALGGVCLNWGCIPTKALLKSAQALHYASRGAEFGFSCSAPEVDIAKVVERSREVASQMSKGIEFLFRKNGVTVIPGTASIPSAGKVDVTSPDGTVSRHEAGRIILATGSRPASLPFAPSDGVKIWNYRHALVPERLPRSLAVIGSGAIGTELAFFYQSMGVQVTLMEYLDRIVPQEDDEVSAQLSRSLRKAGMKVMTSAAVRSIDTSGEGCVVSVDTKKGEETVAVERVLSATGVRPNTEGLGLEQLGVLMQKGRIVVDGSFKTSVDGIYAIGDLIPTPALAHVASAEALRCVESIASLNPEPVRYDFIPSCIYTSPEAASCGITEREAREKGLDCKIGKVPFTASGRAAAAGMRDGFVKIVSDASSGKVLGVHMVGDNVSEMIGAMVVACSKGMTARELSSAVFPHPTMSEAIGEACIAAL